MMIKTEIERCNTCKTKSEYIKMTLLQKKTPTKTWWTVQPFNKTQLKQRYNTTSIKTDTREKFPPFSQTMAMSYQTQVH